MVRAGAVLAGPSSPLILKFISFGFIPHLIFT